jgi:hypothetical protein
MNFSFAHTPPVDLFVHTTIQNREYHFLNKKLHGKPTQLFVKDFEPVKNLTSNFYIGAVSVNSYYEDISDIVGYLFFSSLPVLNVSTAVLAYSGSWRSHSDEIKLTPEDTNLKFRSEDFYLYHVSGGKASLVTVSDLSDKLHDFLTMI